MKPFSKEQHRDALVRRRIKFVVEKGAMARLFRKGSHAELQDELFHRVQLSELRSVETRKKYDEWLTQLVELECWQEYSRNGLEADRWAYFAKLVNIVVYEIVSNRELFSEEDWQRIRPFLHVPIDQTVINHVRGITQTFPSITSLKGMNKNAYFAAQKAVRELATKHDVPPIWFEAAWSAPGAMLSPIPR